MTLVAGEYHTLKVAREVSPYGFFLSDGEEDVLLPYIEQNATHVHVGDELSVFVYHDSEDRLSATLKRPLLTLGKLARLRVADVHPRYGCFLEFGLGRQLLLPLSELPESVELRPLVDDEVFVVMGHDKQGRLIARIAGEEDLSPLVFAAPESWKNLWLEGWVVRTLQMGTFVIIDGGPVGFGVYGMIPASQRTQLPRLGERIRARATFIREDGRVNLSTANPKEVSRLEDADRLLAFLLERPGQAMPYSDETPADVISKRFGISKGAFKRAIGKLLREGKIRQEGSWTHYVHSEASEDASSTDQSQNAKKSIGGKHTGGERRS